MIWLKTEKLKLKKWKRNNYIRCSIGPAAFLKPRAVIKKAEIGTKTTTNYI